MACLQGLATYRRPVHDSDLGVMGCVRYSCNPRVPRFSLRRAVQVRLDMFSMVITVAIISLHALIAWVLVEVFVNNAHRLSRRVYVFWHYVSVVTAFASVFLLYFHFFAVISVFATTLIAMATILLLEFVIFRFLYSAERWFLNYVDWIFPIFLAFSTITFVGTIVLT
jgi:hypothetical protein